MGLAFMAMLLTKLATLARRVEQYPLAQAVNHAVAIPHGIVALVARDAGNEDTVKGHTPPPLVALAHN